MRSLEEKIKSPTYHLTKIQNLIYGGLHSYIEDTEGMNQTKMAEILGVTRGHVSQLMNYGADHRLSKLIKLSLAIGKIPRLELVSPDVFLKEERAIRAENEPLNLYGDHCEFRKMELLPIKSHNFELETGKSFSEYKWNNYTNNAV